VGASLADPLVAQIINPERLQELLNGEAISTDVGAVSLGGARFPTLSAGTALKAWLGPAYWFDRFSIALPVSAAEAQKYPLIMELQQWHWRVVGLDLPEALLQIAQQLAKRSP
jgi:hypothetical protein